MNKPRQRKQNTYRLSGIVVKETPSPFIENIEVLEPIIEGESEITFANTETPHIVIMEPTNPLTREAFYSYANEDKFYEIGSIEQEGEPLIYTEPKLNWWTRFKMFIKRIITKMKNESNY